MIDLNKIGLNQVQLNQLYLNTLCACQKSSGGDGFPHLRGDVTRWSFKGLTNEQMSKNPRLEDADHKGRFLTFNNFAWGKMSGCGGYTYDFRKWLSLTKYASNVGGDIVTISSDKVKIIDATVLNASHGVIKQTSVQKEEIFDFYVNITGLSNIDTSNNPLTFGKFDNPNQFKLKDGINHVQYTKSASVGWVGFGFKKAVEHCDVTIELLPYYPGFIIGDGVDDCAATEKDLDFEDTYTVYTAFIPFKTPIKYPALCGKDYKKDFYINYTGDALSNASFYSSNKSVYIPILNGFNILCCKRTLDKIVIKNLITGMSSEVSVDALIDNPGLYYLWVSLVAENYAKAAIAGQIIDNGHFTTDEEDTKVLNWYKKEYPWLFFDQAWTVTGKTNEDTDRATIANITGNGNNLILSNFGFAGNSGYGEYAYNWNTWKINKVDSTKSNVYHNRMEITLPAIGESSRTQCNFYSPLCEVGTIYDFSFKISGLTGNSTVFVKPGTNGGGAIIARYNKDGVYHLNYTLTDEAIIDESTQNRIYFFIQNLSDEEMNLTIEQIPDHEGYLVTDGIDDKITSSAFTLGKKFTVVGEWEFLNNVNVAAGIVKPNSFFVYNAVTGTQLFLNSTMKVKNYPTKSLKAFCSDGRVYDSNWVEYLQREEQTTESSVGSLNIGINGDKYAQLVLKNIAFFNGKYLSKEDAIKAYIYLQTLKAK